MPPKHKTVDIRVSRRILWFGTEAYPLHHITRTNTRKLPIKRGLVMKRYAASVAPWLAVAAVMLVVAPELIAALAVVAILALIVFKTIRLIEFLNLRLHELVIETAAGSHTGLVSDNETVVSDLAIRITDAINNPLAEFQIQVEKFHVGDNVNMSGDHNIGKEVR